MDEPTEGFYELIKINPQINSIINKIYNRNWQFIVFYFIILIVYHLFLYQEFHRENLIVLSFIIYVLALQINASFSDYTLFVDESTFTNHGQINMCNIHY